ncbi:succinylglutamate desuccinylase/aspartoacylase family protein [Candidatus Falkowbacteria bacterium]|nr:succinylglutamate desuccinylase/aspartoacylase family protein [Candidatus Falkowbacteria bacterium]
MFSYHFLGDVIRLVGARPGKKLVITAGIDGDEFCGIKAANILGSQLKIIDFAGEIVIIPTLNVPGNKTRQSANPIDGRLPKYIFPGNAWGSDSYRLINWLNKNHLKGAHAWIDLHGGNLNEHLNPFIWTFDTVSPRVNELGLAMQQASGCLFGIHEKAEFFSKANYLAQRGCAYILVESGELGEVKEEDVKRHINWVTSLMRILGMLPGHRVSGKMPALYSKVKPIVARVQGEWCHNISSSQISNGEKLGTLSAHYTQDFFADEECVPLWWHKNGNAKRGQQLIVVASRRDIILP